VREVVVVVAKQDRAGVDGQRYLWLVFEHEGDGEDNEDLHLVFGCEGGPFISKLSKSMKTSQ
jgi:hypothetical protein